MIDENKTIADLLKSIDDKTVDRSEAMPILQSIERNTSINMGKAIAAAVGTAVSKAMEKPGGGKKVAPEPAKAIAVPGVVAPEPAKAKTKDKAASVSPTIAAVAKTTAVATAKVKKSVYAAQPTTTPAVVARDVSGKFTSKTTGTDGVAQQQQDNQADKLSSILKDAVGSRKETIKDTAGRMAMGPFYDIGKEILEATGSMRDNAKDEKSTMGRLKNWGQAKMGIKPNKAEATHDKAQAKHDKVEAASDKAEAKHYQLQAKADKAKQGAKSGTAAGATTVVNNESGGGIVSEIAGNWLGNKLGGSKLGGKLLSKVPFLGKLFPSLAGAGTVATEAAGGVASGVAGASGGMFSGMMAKAGGLASKIPGAGMLGKIGGRIPLLGGLISAGTTLATGGSKSEAVGSGVGTTAGAMAGGALGSLLGPVGTVAGAALGGIAGDWIGTKLGGLFNNQNKADADKIKQQQELLKSQGEQQQGFWDKMAGSSNPLMAGIGNLVGGVKNSVSAAGSAYSQVRERGGGFFESVGAGIKGGFKASKGKALGREQQLEQAAVSSGMTDPKELAMFMAQAKHETAGFNTMEEYASGANYEGRKDLGNTQAGDGKRFKGRGYFQLTGRANYADMSNKVGADLVNNPELAEDPAIAAKIALQYWKDKKLSAAAKAGDAQTVTKKINGGLNGYDDRVTNLQGYNTKYANGVPGATAGAAPTTPLVPGTPEFAAKQAEMQAKFIADQQGTTPTKVASAAGTTSNKKKSGKGKKKEAAPATVAQAIPKPAEDAVKPEEKKPEEQTAEGQKATEATTPTTVAAQATLPAREAKTKRDKEISDAARASVVTQQAAAKAEYAAAKTPEEKQAVLDKLQAGRTATQDKAISDIQAPPAVTPVQVASAEGTAAATIDKPRLAKKSSQLAAENATQQNVTVAATTAVQTPLPQPQPVQLPPPPSVEVPGLEKLAKSQEQQAVKKPEVVASASIPNIKTEFDDTMLVLMSYDRI